jgi:hypothetical protein
MPYRDSPSMPIQPIRVGFGPLAADFIPFRSLGIGDDGLYRYSVSVNMEVFDALVGKGMFVFNSSLPMEGLKMTSNTGLRQKRTAKGSVLIADGV